MAPRAQQFSAEIVEVRDSATVPAGHLRVRDGRVRIETPELADGFFLVDSAKRIGLFRSAGDTHLYGGAAVKPTHPIVCCRRPERAVPAMAGDGEVAGVAARADWRCERPARRKSTAAAPTCFRVTSAGNHEFVGWLDRERTFSAADQDRRWHGLDLEHIRMSRSLRRCSNWRRTFGNSARRPRSSGSSRAMSGSASQSDGESARR